MKPYLLVSGDFVHTGGMDMANFALARYLAEAGNEVHLVAHTVAKDLIERPNVIFHRVPKIANSYMLGGPLVDHKGRGLAAQIKARGGRVIVNGGNCQFGDINWVHYVHAAYKPYFGKHSLRSFKSYLTHSRALANERNALQSARIVIVNSDRTRRDVTERLRIPAERVHKVYYGIDAQRFQPLMNSDRRKITEDIFKLPAHRPVVIFIGALGDRRKGFDTLFEAWDLLCRDRNWDVNLVVIGAGAELPAWHARSVSLGLESRIRFLGFRKDVQALLTACDALIAPTRYEAYGLAVQEALCCGLPSLVSRGAGVAERYPPALQELIIPDPESAIALVERIRLWRNEEKRLRSVTRSFSDELRAHSWEQMAAQFVNLCENAI
jgi:glycosyltransferase involved in cell wall biosynthesis